VREFYVMSRASAKIIMDMPNKWEKNLQSLSKTCVIFFSGRLPIPIL